MVSPVFLLVVFGVLEFGVTFRDYLTVSNASQGGARAGAIAGNDPDADFRSSPRSGSRLRDPSAQVVRVVVFEPRTVGQGAGGVHDAGTGSEARPTATCTCG